MRARSKVALLALTSALAAGSLLVAGSARAAGADPTSATPVQREQAQERFKAGNDFLKQNNYAAALPELRASLEIVASPNTRLLVARCLRGLGKLVEAYAELGRTIVEGKELAHEDPRYERVSASASDERDDLAKEIGLVTVTVDHASEGTTMKIGGEDIRRAAWGEPAPVAVGAAEVIVQTPGHEPATKAITVTAGGKQSIAIDAQTELLPGVAAPPTDTATPTPVAATGDHRNLRPYAYVAGGVGAAGLLTFVIAGLMANSTYSGLKDACGSSNTCPPSKADDISSGKTQQTVANVGLVIGALGAAAGAALFIFSMPKSVDSAQTTAVVLGPGWLGVRGSL